MKVDPKHLNTVLVTDCGSTTTKALLFERTPKGWRKTYRGEAPTTVEAPVADVTVGALNAFGEIEEVSNRKIIDQEKSVPLEITDRDKTKGIDLYLSTSSAGGGLQMLVTGIVKSISTESAERAALGAGAIVMDAICADDGRADHERIERIRHLKPDIVLMAGGLDSGSKTHVVEMAEMLVAAAPRPRFGDTLKLPVIYAGNKDAAQEVSEILASVAQVKVVDNVRPDLNRESLKSARDAIHEFFLSHVMSHAPGYGKLLSWTPVAVMPTPAAVGDMVLRHARRNSINVLCADIGGATTDVFSVFKNREGLEVFNRTVSANYGMSYSIANVLIEAGPDKIARWLPYELGRTELVDRIRNKMIRPTSIPQTLEDLWLEQAVCREALRLSLHHHRMLAVGLSGTQQKRSIADFFSQDSNRYELVDLNKLNLVIGSGGVLSHAPHRLSAALMMIDGFELQGITQIAVDSIFMMPHLGVFCSAYPEAADEIFIHDCLIQIGHCIAPVYNSAMKGENLGEIEIDGKVVQQFHRGSVVNVALTNGQKYKITLIPSRKDVNFGAGPGIRVEQEIEAGEYGLILDGRNRPIELPQDSAKRVQLQREIYTKLGLVNQ